MEINGKICVVTGALGGIGLSIVKKLLDNGVKFTALFDLDNPRNRNSFNALKEKFGERVEFYPCDVTKKAQLTENFDKVVRTHKVVDILINNAAIFCELEPELMIDINYKAVVTGTLMIIERMGKHKGGNGGVVVNAASILGLINICGLPIYSSIKHAVVSFTRCLEEQFEITGVRVMAVCPGATKTPMVNAIDLPQNRLEFTYYPRSDSYSILQNPDNVGDAVAKIIKIGKSGQCWVSEDNQAPYLTRSEVVDYKDLRVE